MVCTAGTDVAPTAEAASYGGAVMSTEITQQKCVPTSVELLDAAVWREIGSEEPQPRAAFVEALSALVGRWLLVRSDAPDMDLMTVMCRARGYIERGGAEQSRGMAR
jgi:adenylate cyclase